MNREQFEASILDLWVTTRIPLSRAHLQFHTGVSRLRVSRWLDELTGEGVLECDVDDSGEMLWRIPGAERAAAGPRTFAELGRGRGAAAGTKAKPTAGEAGSRALAVRAQESARTPARRRGALDDADEAMASLGLAALTLAKRTGSSMRKRDEESDREHKSLILSAGLSFLGPLGWLYAGSLREALPATALAVLAAAIIPTFLLMPILWLALPLSAVVGLVYAWQYNRHGQRTPLFLDDKKGDKDSDS